MYYLLSFIFLLVLVLKKRQNNCYLTLAVLQVLSFVASFFVANVVSFDTFLTSVNIVYCFVLLLLIILPWSDFSINEIYVKDKGFQRFYESILRKVLIITMFNNIIVLGVVLVFTPDISAFKNSHEFTKLYESIPYFSLLFRYCSVSKYLGVLAVPISFYYLSIHDNKKAIKMLILSSATLIGAIAFYSRAQILSYILILAASFFLIENAVDITRRKVINKYLKLFVTCVCGIFITISIVRFSAMSYYGDRIPKESFIQEPIAYSIFDYTSKGFPNGIDQLELHQDNDILYGAQCTYSLNLCLGFLKLTNWNPEHALSQFENSYNKSALEDNDAGSFHGFSCRMVKNFGYIISFLLCLLYFNYVRKKSKLKSLSVTDFSILIFLLAQPILSIFYMDWDMCVFPFLFYIIAKFLFKFKIR